MLSDPRVISIDVETYGMAMHDWSRRPLPEQSHYHPVRCTAQDGVPLPSLVLSCSLTIPVEDTRSGDGEGWDADAVSRLRPGPTMALRMDFPPHVRRLVRWLRYADTLIGWNIVYDLLMLRAFHPSLRHVLDGRHTLLDGTICNYLANEMRMERSLKAVGPLLGDFIYRRTFGTHGRYANCGDPLLDYNCDDTWNTVLATARLTENILSVYGLDTSKMSPWCINFYSDSLWSIVRMSETGVPIDRSMVEHLASVQAAKVSAAYNVAAAHGVLLHGKDSQTTQKRFLAPLMYGERDDPHPLVNHSLAEFTKEEKRLSLGDINRRLVSLTITDPEPLRILRAWDAHSAASKMISTYFTPLLDPKGSDACLPDLSSGTNDSRTRSPISNGSSPSSSSSYSSSAGLSWLNGLPPGSSLPPGKRMRRVRSKAQWMERRRQKLLRSGRLGKKFQQRAARLRASKIKRTTVVYGTPPLPSRPSVVPIRPPNVQFAYPSWYATPAFVKDNEGQEGGQKQMRLSAKNPALLTWNSIIKRTLAPPEGCCLVMVDVSQAELGTAAMLTGEPSLLRAFTSGIDLHAERALQVFPSELKSDFDPATLDDWLHKRNCEGEAYDDFSTRFRQPCKHANFTDLNWGGSLALQRTILKKAGLLIPFRTCHRIVSSRSKVRPVLVASQERWVEQTHAHGYLELPYTGCSRWFMAGEKFDANEIVNLPIQATAATMVRSIQHWIDQHYPLNAPRLSVPSCFGNVYDALWYIVPLDQREPFLAKIKAAFEWEQAEGYWSMLQNETGHIVPLSYEVKEVHRDGPGTAGDGEGDGGDRLLPGLRDREAPSLRGSVGRDEDPSREPSPEPARVH